MASRPRRTPPIPIMPLSEVRPGMKCTGLSVIHGTEISSFDVEILDVIARRDGPQRPAPPGARVRPGRGRHRHRPRLLGLADRTATAATPARSPRASASTATRWCWPRRSRRCSATGRRAAPRAAARTDPPCCGPRGRSPRRSPCRGLAGRAAGARPGRPPAAPAGRARGARRAARRLPAAVDLRPGAAVAATLSTGDLALGAIGTVDLPRRRRASGRSGTRSTSSASARCSSRTPTCSAVI